jgi:hypothetical protein
LDPKESNLNQTSSLLALQNCKPIPNKLLQLFSSSALTCRGITLENFNNQITPKSDTPPIEERSSNQDSDSFVLAIFCWR